MRLESVSPAQVWDEAKGLLAAALHGSGDSAAEVRMLCEVGRACLLRSGRSYVVLLPVPCADGFDLLIWAAASRGARDCIAAHLEELEQLARGAGARRLAFRTSRRGFQRVMPAGWSIRQMTWAKEL